MKAFTVDPRDGGMSGNACSVCCCQNAQARPGETDKWVINFAPWSVPIGGHGLTEQHQFDITKIPSNSPTPTNPPPSVQIGLLDIVQPANVTSGDLTDYATGTGTLTFAVLPMFGAQNGKLVINSDGTFTYDPNAGYSGYEHFFYTVSDSNPANLPVIGEVIIGVSPPTPAPAIPDATADMATPAILIPAMSYSVNRALHQISFAAEISPAAKPGDIYRLTIRQQAVDCNSQPYWHISCYDVLIGKC